MNDHVGIFFFFNIFLKKVYYIKKLKIKNEKNLKFEKKKKNKK